MAEYDVDLVIAGAGPAGCTLALSLAGSGLRIAVIEKDVFPRHKICGDALSGKVLSVMKRMPGGVYDAFIREVDKIPSWGIRFTAPGLRTLDIPFTPPGSGDGTPPGYVCKRNDFDNFLFDRVNSLPGTSVFQGEKVTAVTAGAAGVTVTTASHKFHARAIAAADGVHSVCRRSLTGQGESKDHRCIGIRAYYENVTGLHPGNFIELLFLRELLPGYFWIFPSTGGQVNAGLGLMHNQVVSRKVNLNTLLEELIHTHPVLEPRFRNARATSRAEAHTLPLGSCTVSRSGERYLLLGDAASLVDPFSGEGIGNAMASGEIAAAILLDCFRNNDLSAGAMKGYDARIERRFGQEFRTTTVMQRLARSPWLFNLVVDKARKNRAVSELLSSMFTNEDLKKRLTRPGFYAGLLFSKNREG